MVHSCSPEHPRPLEESSNNFAYYTVPSELHIYIYIYGVRSSGHPTGQKVKPNMADMEALSYVGFSPPAQFLLYT